MKHLLFLLCCCITVSLHAQITVTDATFPTIGDTLRLAVRVNPPANDDYTSAPGGPQQWDFTSLLATSRQEIEFLALIAEPDSLFPDAEMAVIGAGQIETYYKSSATAFENLGYRAPDFAGFLPIETALRYTPPYKERTAPLNFFDVIQFNVSATIPVAIEEIPAEILDSLGIPTDLADSIRYRYTASILGVVDGYGTLSIPGGTYDVLRKKHTEYRENHVDVHSIFGWLDVTGFVPQLAAFAFDTLNAYEFISNTEKEIIAFVEFDSAGQASQVTFKDNGVGSGIRNPETLVECTIAPNPAINTVRFISDALQGAECTLALFDVSGKQVFRKEHVYADDEISLHHLQAGTYLYQISEGDLLRASGKLEILPR